MTTTNFRSQIVAIVATVLVSTACLTAAIGPAATQRTSQPVVAERALA